VLYASVASGDVEIGFNQISEILAQPTVELAGPLLAAMQNYTQFAPGILTGSSQTDAGRALLAFLASPEAQTVLKSKGFRIKGVWHATRRPRWQFLLGITANVQVWVKTGKANQLFDVTAQPRHCHCGPSTNDA
jgi:hypothetical protein